MSFDNGHPKLDDRDWYRSIKSIREKQNVNILNAAKIMLQNEKWRRWVVLRVRDNRKCLKEAKSYIKSYGDDAPFYLDDDRLIFRDQDG